MKTVGAALASVAVLAAAVLPVAGCGTTPIDAIGIDGRSLARGLVAHWTFDDGAGTAVRDRSGNGHDGTLTGGTWVERGRFAGALRLSKGDFVQVAGFPQAAGSWSVSVWIQVSAADLIMQWGTLLSTENVFAGGWQLHLDDRPNSVRFDAAYWVSEADEFAEVACACVETDRWIHLVSVIDGATSRFGLYRDGALVDTLKTAGPLLPGDPTLLMGKWNMEGDRFFTGLLDDVAIWNRALTADEVATLTREPPADGP